MFLRCDLRQWVDYFANPSFNVSPGAPVNSNLRVHMPNLAISLALFTYWCSFYAPLPPVGLASTGIAVVPLMILAGSFVVWLLLTRKLLSNYKPQNRWFAYILWCANIFALLNVAVHSYNAALGSAPSSIEAVMASSYLGTLELFLRACYPFAKWVVVISLVAHGYYFYKLTRVQVSRLLP